MKRKDIAWKTLGLDLLFDVVGAVLYSAALHVFASQGGFATGGISGLSLIINHLTDLPLGMIMLVINVPIVAVCYRVVGRQFLLKSLRSMAFCYLFLDFLFPGLPVYTGSPLLAALYAGALLGAGLSFFYLRGSSSGGDDFITVSIKTLYPHLTIGTVMMVLDFFIILLGWPVFGSLDAVLYGLVTTTACSTVLDKILYGAGAGRLVLIITQKGQAVSDAISERCGRGATILSGTGAYTGQDRDVLLCACARREAHTVRSAVWAEDEDAFVMLVETSEVFGEGFRPREKKQR